MPAYFDPFKERVDSTGGVAATWAGIIAGPDDDGDDRVALAMLLVDGEECVVIWEERCCLE